MRIAVLGTGVVGRTLSEALVVTGNEVIMGSRTADNEEATAWSRAAGPSASNATFADAAASAEVIVNATRALFSVDALQMAGAANLSGKVLVDVTNPVDFSVSPPSMLFPGESAAERIQAAFPDARVVKTLNTMNHDLMVDPSLVRGEHVVFLCGNDHAAKTIVGGLLEGFGWPDERILDLGPLSHARSVEMYLPLWASLNGVIGTEYFNIQVNR
jgi:8-hydroxy-5-deazaflavin:NADPH oxidoreductase